MRYRGNVEKYRAFYSEHKDKLFAYLMRMTGDYYLSSDIMQEAFTRHLERYPHEVARAPLLYAIARNALFDHLRRQRKNVDLEGDLTDCCDDQEHALMVRQEYRRVLLALRRLDGEQRDLLALAISGDLSYHEIASVTGISEANVKVRIHRARLKLREILDGGDV